MQSTTLSLLAGLWDHSAPSLSTDDQDPCLLRSCTQPQHAWQVPSTHLLS